MSRGIADTSLFIAHEHGLPVFAEELPDELGISVVTVGELRAAVLRATDVVARSRRLDALTAALGFDPAPVDGAVVEAWALLDAVRGRDEVRLAPTQWWIAATALALGVPLVTREHSFEVDGLEVIRV